MSEYCTPTDVQNRLTENGYKWVANRGGHGTPSPEEITAYITSAIEYAGSILDEAVEYLGPVGGARGSGNKWLRDRAKDIAAWYATSQGGRTPPEVFTEAKNDALERVQWAKDGGRIPGLIYVRPYDSPSITARLPRVVNPQ